MGGTMVGCGPESDGETVIVPACRGICLWYCVTRPCR